MSLSRCPEQTSSTVESIRSISGQSHNGVICSASTSGPEISPLQPPLFNNQRQPRSTRRTIDSVTPNVHCILQTLLALLVKCPIHSLDSPLAPLLRGLSLKLAHNFVSILNSQR